MAHDDLAAHAAELLAPLGRVRQRRMFGGHGLYVDDLFIALVADGLLYLKADTTSQPRFEAAGCSPFRYQARGQWHQLMYYTPPAEALESPALMQPWARLAMQAALSAQAARTAKAPARPRTRKTPVKPRQAPR
jgi:DNA transformation protein